MKKALVVSLASMCIVLSGCSSIHNSLEQKMLAGIRDKSEITSDSGYAQFEQYTAQGNVVDGYYAPNGEAISLLEDDTEALPSGIQVSFASNNHLNVRYYYDSDFTTQIDIEKCFLAPGSSIYAKVEIGSGVTTNMYSFSSFRIVKCDSEGQRSPLADVQLGEDGLLWRIPDGFDGTDIVIEPLGKYESRLLSFQDYSYGSNSKRKELDFTWTVNGKTTKGNSLEISPTQPYIVSYAYNENEYFFVSSNPACYSYNDNEGTVSFSQISPDQDVTSFSVELHPYMTSKIKVNVEAVYCQGDNESKLGKKDTYTASHLKYGDKITIKTEETCDIEYDSDLFALSKDDENHRYTLTVREGAGDFVFDPNAYTFAHGDIVFTYSGQVITSKTILAKGRQIEYYAENIDPGYWLPDGNHTIIVGEDSETKASIEKIRFYLKDEVTVSLPQPAYGGRITYSINGTTLYGDSVTTYCGTPIQLKLSAWNGWKIRLEDDTAEYIVREGNQNQSATINDSDVNHAFEELPQHKPTLIVNLDKSVGTNMMFDITTASGKTASLSYGSGGLSGVCKIYESTVGTSRGITIKAQQDEIQEGKVLKIAVVLTDTQKNKTHEVYYIEQLPNDVCIPIYQPSEIASSQTYYKTIEVTVSVVNKRVYQPVAVPNAVVVLTAIDVKNQPKLQAGDILDDARKVQVVIKPNNGYYVTGNKVKFDQYQNEMNFGKYLEDIQSILNKHPVKKIYTVVLDSADDFGTVVYTLDGKPVNGKVQLREEQKLVIKYTITAPGYQIARSNDGLAGLYNRTIASKTEDSVTIEIASSLDGRTIRRADYIQIRKEG